MAERGVSHHPAKPRISRDQDRRSGEGLLGVTAGFKAQTEFIDVIPSIAGGIELLAS